MSFKNPQNPGWVIPEELTSSELNLIQELSALGAPAGDRILFYDSSANGYSFLQIGSGLSITDTTMTATGTVGGSGTTNELTYWVNSSTLGALATTTYPNLTELSRVKGVTSAIQTQLNDRELLTNKATSFGTLNDTLYPTTQAVATYVASQVVGLLDYRGSYDASTNLFPATGGSGLAGAILKGDFYIVSVFGTLGGTAVTAGDLIIALVDTPGQTASNWDLISNELGYTPANNTLSNLGTVAINTSLISDTDSTDSIGSTGVRWLKGWFDDMETTNMPTVGGTSLSSIFQPLDSDLTTIAGLTATTDNFIVSVASAWASRTPAQVRETLYPFSDLGTDPTVTLVANSSYLAQTSFFGSAVLTLPATANVGDRISIQFKSGGLDTFRLSQQALQYIRYSIGAGFGTTTVGTGGYLTASNATFALEIICIEANIGWAVVNLTGSLLQVEASSTYFSAVGFDTTTTGGTLLGTTGTQTVTSKRIQPRTASSTSNANLTPDLSSANVYYRTTQTTGLTINAPTGTPVIGETILIYVDSAGAQTLTINATFIPFGAAFPATTTAGKTFMMSCQYNGTNWKTLWANAV